MLHPHYTVSANTSATSLSPLKERGLVKNSKAVVPVEDAVKMIQKVLPSPMVERSWGFGPQRLCQELRGIIVNLRGRVKQNDQ